MGDFRELMEKRANGSTPYKPIAFKDKTQLSVQASKSHYSAPRKDGLHLYEYTQFEVAIIKGGEFTTGQIPEFSTLGNQVAAYVDVKTVQKVFNRLKDECGGVVC